MNFINIRNKFFGISTLLTTLAIGLLGNANAAPPPASTSMTIVSVTNWIEEACKSPRAVTGYSVTEYMYNFEIHANGVYWNIYPGTTFTDPAAQDVGDWARLWAIWSDNGGRTYSAIGWDFTTNSATYKHAENFGQGTSWVGQMISTICDQTSCAKDTWACSGRKRSNIAFVAN